MDLHQDEPVAGGAAPAEAGLGVVLVHGRGASPQSILSLADAFQRDDVSYLAPPASGNTWYPYSFLAPLHFNEPGLSAALASVGRACERFVAEGIELNRVLVVGFSQGACLALEYAARNPRRYGGIVAFSGGLIGNGDIEGAAPPDDKRFEYHGSLAGTPVFFGCSDEDPHIPLKRVRDSATVFRTLEADVTERVYPGMGHTVNADEVAFVRDLFERITSSDR